jgi:hypothetical protein
MELLRRFSPGLHPILFAAYPLLALFALNQTEVQLAVLWVPLALCVAAGIVLYGVFWLIFKEGPKAGALASLVCLTFFYYGIFLEKADGWGLSKGLFLALWLAIFVIAAVWLVLTRRGLESLTLILIAGSVVLIVAPIVKIAVYQANHPGVDLSDPRLFPTALADPTPASGTPRPDIYVICPDDYARNDVLKQQFGYDNAPFIRQLEQRGFVISNQNRSPYSDSELNIAAEVNMDYMTGLPKILGSDSEDSRPPRTMIEDNRASRLLETLGYRYVHLDTDEVTYSAGNPNISAVAAPDSFMSLWLQQSVLRTVGGPIGFNDASLDERFRGAIDSVFDQLAAVSEEPGPKFVFFHTLIPHDPYVFGSQGQPVTFTDKTGEEHSSRRGMRYYLHQLQGLNQRLLDAVDAIQANSDIPPVILLMADEGFEGREAILGEATLLDVRVKGLLAMSLPGAGKPSVPQPPNTVNALRFVFNRYFGTDYPMLPSSSYPEGDPFPYQFTDELRVR